MEAYLKITAPFDGVVTDRFVHPGALVGPGADPALLVIQQVSRLRLVVPVPEEDVGGMARGRQCAVSRAGLPGADLLRHRGAHRPRARSEDAHHAGGTGRRQSRRLARARHVSERSNGRCGAPVPALFVPKTSVVTTTERTFVIRDRNGRAEWVDVKKGAADGDLIEVIGNLRPGDMVVRRATDEIRDGAPLQSMSVKR